MSLRGKVTIEHRDKYGRLIHKKNSHNTITELGKSAALFFGVSSLAQSNYTTPSIKTGFPLADQKMFYSNMYAPAKTGLVECDLLNVNISDISGKDSPEMFVPSSSELIGFAGTKVAGDALNSKEGIRTDVDPEGLAGNKIKLAFSWEGIQGQVKTLTMNIVPTCIWHTLPNLFDTSNYFIPQGQNGVPAGSLAAGGSDWTRLLSLDTLAESDFLPTGLYSSGKTICALNYNGYSVEMLTNTLRVTKLSDGTTYEETWTNIKGLFVSHDTLYAYVVSGSTRSMYSLTITDSETQASPVSDISSVINSEHANANFTDAYLCGLTDGSIVYTRYIYGSYELRLVFDVSSADYYLLATTSSINGFNVSTYLGSLIDNANSKIIPAGQIGKVYSYFDLEQTWTINTTDTVKVTYTYELTEVTQ